MPIGDSSKNPYLTDGIASYPNPNIDPRDKGFDWIYAYTKAAYNDTNGYMTGSSLNTGRMKMAEIKSYVLGKQSVSKYQKMMSPGDLSDDSWRAIDWTPPAFMCKYREIAISKLIQKKWDVQAYAVDPIARSEEDAHFNQMKVKMLMREQARQAGSPIADSPLLAPQPGEPEDMEQLMMQKEFTYKHAMSQHAEEAISLVFGQNDMEELRKQTVTSLYDFGPGAYTQYLDENGMVKLRSIDMENFGCSYFEKPDGSDMIHWFEVVPTYVGDLAPYYTKEQLDKICQLSINQNGNPTNYTPVNAIYNRSWMRFKVFVMHIKFLSWNDTIYKTEKDKRNNTRFGKSDYKNIQFLSVNESGEMEGDMSSDSNNYFDAETDTGTQGEQTPKYLKSTKKVVYKASLVVNTEYMHDWGLMENQNRKLSSWWDTDLNIQFYAWNFYKMQFTGISERLIPLEDKACMAWFNLQNLSNKLIPYIINMDMNALEGAFPYGKQGKKGKPSEVVDFIFSNFIAPYRSTDLLSRNPNYKPVSIEATGQLAAFAQRYDELGHTLEMMRQISGLNELTDGSTPNAKTLVPVAQAAVESTNNAIYLVSEADRWLYNKTADAAVMKVQIAVQLGKVEGYAKALGSSAIKFFSINPRLALHELGIFTEAAPTDAQREALWQDLQVKDGQGFITPGDKHFIMTCRNLTGAYSILDYKIEKRKQEAQAQQMQQTQAAAEANGQVAQQVEGMKQQTIQVQLQADLIRIQTEMEWQYRIEAMKKTVDYEAESVQAEARNVGHQIQAEAKVEASKIAAGAQMTGKHMDSLTHLTGKGIDAEAAIEKQKEANKKPKPTASK